MPEALNSSPKFPGSNSPRKRPHASSASGAETLHVPRPNGIRSESVGGGGYGVGPNIINNISTATLVSPIPRGGGGDGGRNVGVEGSSASTSMLASGGTTPMVRGATTGPILTPATDVSGFGSSNQSNPHDTPERQLDELNEKLKKEIKMKEGAENLLQVLNDKNKKPKDKEGGAKAQAQKELTIANFNIQQIQNQIHAIKRPRSNLNFPKGGVVRQKSVRLAGVGITGGTIHDTLNADAVAAQAADEAEGGMGLSLADIMAALEEMDKPPEYYVGQANSLVVFFRRNPNYKYDLSWKEFGKRVQFMLLHTSKEVVAAGYRMTRYAITDISSLRHIRALSTDLMVIRSLSRDAKSNVEREQALKFVRAFMDVKGGGVKQISTGVIRAIISCAEQDSDRLRGVCLETLTELLILDPERILQCGGVKILTQVLREGPYDFAEFIYPAFLYLLDMPATRQYVRAGCDLEGVLAAFTDARAVSAATLISSASIICGILKTWTGLMYLSMYNLRAIRCLVECLSIPSANIREIIIDILSDVFGIKPPGWTSSFLAGRRLTTYGRVQNLKSDLPTISPERAAKQKANPGNLVDHYIALLLSVFFEAGMMDALMVIVQDVDLSMLVVRKTTLLIGETLKLASRLLPNGYSARKQLLPSLFNSAARFDQEDRFAASAAVYQIDSLTRTLHRTLAAANTTQRASLDDQKGGRGQAEQVRMNMNMNIDDTHFRSLILETNVLNTKNHLKWNWTALKELIRGPLLNPKRLEEAIKATKFLKRLLSFYRPFKHRFADIQNTKPNQKYVQLGCSLFHTLLQSQEGVKYLAENKLLRQIAECLAQLDKMSGITSHIPVFSRARLSDTLSSGYFTMLGALSSDPKGLAMMSKWCMFSMFYHLSDLNDREDLIQMFLGAMDFTLEGHPRILFTKVLTSGARGVRLFCTNHLRFYISNNNNAEAPQRTINPNWTVNTETAEWATRELITQLYDPDVEVCETAVKILEEACNNKDLLEYLVSCRPQLDHLGEIGAPLLLKFLSTSIGYHYLNDLDYIEREMDDWFHGRNDSYVLTVEASFARAFIGVKEELSNLKRNESPSYDPDMMGLVPPHFYRELARTTEGCRLLEDKGHFEEFAWFIHEHGLESSDPEIVTKLKGCLWAVGNIGCMQYGVPFLDKSNTVEDVIKIAKESEVWTVKGTAFFVLGLISRTMTGLETLAQHGWDVTTGPMGESSGFCVPDKLEHVLWSKKASWKMGKEFAEQINVEGDDSNEVKILTKVGELNGMENIEVGYLRELNRMKTVMPTYFTSPSLYLKVMQVLENYRFRPNIRRHIIDLFDRGILEIIAKERYPDEGNPLSPGADSITTITTEIEVDESLQATVEESSTKGNGRKEPELDPWIGSSRRMSHD